MPQPCYCPLIIVGQGPRASALLLPLIIVGQGLRASALLFVTEESKRNGSIQRTRWTCCST